MIIKWCPKFDRSSENLFFFIYEYSCHIAWKLKIFYALMYNQKIKQVLRFSSMFVYSSV